MHGHAGRLLRVNLSLRKVEWEPIAKQDIMDFVGGRGFGSKYLYNELSPNVDPLGEHNKLMLLPGVLAGTPAQSVSRWVAVTKSPLTGCFATACAGADFGAWMKFAGCDFILIEGKSEKPVYLYVTADGCKIEDAHEIWGRDTGEAQEWLSQRYGKGIRVACIGPAGENLVKYAAIVSEKRTASRCGVGTVMGSKKLKAVAIEASRNINLYDPDGFKQLVREQISMIQSSKAFHVHKKRGTTDGYESRNLLGVYPVKNYRYGELAGCEKLSENEYRKLQVGEFGCYGCPAKCGKIHAVKTGPYAGARSEGPEYESYFSFSGPIDSTDIGATIAADQLCDNLGLDSISTGGCIGFAYELYEKGIISKGDTDGLELTYGNHAAMITLIKKIGQREGFGDILAEGTVRAARTIGKGADYYAMQVKGLELAGYEPRALKATGFGYATANIGGSHNYGSIAFQEWGMPVPREVDRFTEEGKADIVVWNQNRVATAETGCICVFSFEWGNWYPRLFGKMLAAATGIEEFADWSYLDKVGDRMINLDRAFNVRDGFDRSQDTLPKRFQTEPLHTIKAEGEGQMVTALDGFLDEYYQLRGWTRNGIPTAEKLRELGLGYVVKEIEPFLKKTGTK